MDNTTTNTGYPLFSYPLSPSKKDHLDAWLDSLPNQPTPTFRRCSRESQLHFETDPIGDSLVTLPCGCNFPRATIGPRLSQDSWNEDNCPNCGFKLFATWTLEGWIDEQQHIELSTLSSENQCCGICRMDYAPAGQEAENEDEYCSNPVKLSCSHVFGRQCLLDWLEPAPKGGNGNSCPACRRVLFRPWPSVSDLEGFEDGEILDDNAFEPLEISEAELQEIHDLDSAERQAALDEFLSSTGPTREQEEGETSDNEPWIPEYSIPDHDPRWAAATDRVFGLTATNREQAEYERTHMFDAVEEHEYLDFIDSWAGEIPAAELQLYAEWSARRDRRREGREERSRAWMEEIAEALEFEGDFLRFVEGLGGQNRLPGEQIERERLRVFGGFLRERRPEWSDDRIGRVVDFLDGRYVMEGLIVEERERVERS